MKIISEFKEFALKGNAIELAVGVVVGTAFQTIVKSLVNDIIMPMIGMLLGKVEFTELKWVLQEAVLDAEGVEIVSEVAVRYGLFIQSIVDFLIVAAAVFVMLKVITKLANIRKNEEAVAEYGLIKPTEIKKA